ncbi:MAG: DNA-binding protein [Paludibacteraceae bacterium]|nr:DNA-binding protein [Paludibacteraceae bacterium]
MYKFRKEGNTYVLSIANHQDLAATLVAFASEQHIKAGSISGIGAVSQATLRFYNPSTKLYEDHCFAEQMEIANLIGNFSTLNGEPYLHLHITLGRADFTSIAGHLLTAQINGACELVVEKYDDDFPRYKDPETGLNLYEF